MRRRAWIAALFGGTAAAQFKSESTTATCWTGRPASHLVGIDRCMPANGECPICGEMAKPWKRQTETEFYGKDVCLSGWTFGSTTTSICRKPSETERVGQKEKVVRCAKCNAAFWQDAEAE